LPVPLLLVLAIGVPLASLTVFGITTLMLGQLRAARTQMSRLNLREIQQHAAEALIQGDGGCPTYDSLVRDQYLFARADSQLGTIRIDCKDDSIVVHSSGLDGKFGTSDDLTTEP